MLLIILLVLALFYVQTMLPGFFLTAQVGSKAQMGGRDNLPEPTQELARSRRALANMQESLPIFLTLAILSVVLGEDGWLSILGGVVYLVGRIAHVYCYMNALAPWRSISYVLGLIGMLLIALPLLPHIWS